MFDIDNALKKIRFEKRPAGDALRQNVLRMAYEQTQKKSQAATPARMFPRFALLCTAALLVCAALIALWVPTQQTVSYYTIDINPSISIQTDSNDQVLFVTAENDDAAELLEGLTFPGFSFEDTLRAIVRSAAKQGYLQQNSCVLVAHFGDTPGMAPERIEAAVNESAGITAKVLVLESTKKEYEKAKRQRAKPGIALLYEKAMEMGISGQDVAGLIDSVRGSKATEHDNANGSKKENEFFHGNSSGKKNGDNKNDVKPKEKTQPDKNREQKDRDERKCNPSKADPQSGSVR